MTCHRIPESVQNNKLSRFIKINHYVSTENNIKISHARIILKVMIVKLNFTHNFLINLISAGRFCKILRKIIRRDSINLVVSVKTALSNHKRLKRNIRSSYLKVITYR